MKRDPQLGFLAELIDLARLLVDPDRVILFGSRARGDARRESDVDLAFSFPAGSGLDWGRFCIEAESEMPTLLAMDLVNMAEADVPLLDAIKQEGVVLYERESSAADQKS